MFTVFPRQQAEPEKPLPQTAKDVWANDRPNYLFWSKFNPDKPVWCNTGPESGQCWNVWGIIHLSLSLVHTQHNDLDHFF